jgi:hypothetical protein
MLKEAVIAKNLTVRRSIVNALARDKDALAHVNVKIAKIKMKMEKRKINVLSKMNI